MPVFFFRFCKLNALILVRVIKEMTAMEQAKDNHAEQIRCSNNNIFAGQLFAYFLMKKKNT